MRAEFFCFYLQRQYFILFGIELHLYLYQKSMTMAYMDKITLNMPVSKFREVARHFCRSLHYFSQFEDCVTIEVGRYYTHVYPDFFYYAWKHYKHAIALPDAVQVSEVSSTS
jgi:hypothetical protein